MHETWPGSPCADARDGVEPPCWSCAAPRMRAEGAAVGCRRRARVRGRPSEALDCRPQRGHRSPDAAAGRRLGAGDLARSRRPGLRARRPAGRARGACPTGSGSRRRGTRRGCESLHADALAGGLDDARDGRRAGRPPRAGLPGGGSGDGRRRSPSPVGRGRSRDLERGVVAGPHGRCRGMVGHAPGRGGQRLLRLRSRQPDPLRRAAARRGSPTRRASSAGVEQIIAREAAVDDAELARFVAMPVDRDRRAAAPKRRGSRIRSTRSPARSARRGSSRGSPASSTTATFRTSRWCTSRAPT